MITKSEKQSDSPVKKSTTRWFDIALLVILLAVNASIMVMTNKTRSHMQRELAVWRLESTRPMRDETDKLLDDLNKYRANEVGPYHLVIDIHADKWSQAVDALEFYRANATMTGPAAFGHGDGEHGLEFYDGAHVVDGQYNDHGVHPPTVIGTATLTSAAKAVEAPKSARHGDLDNLSGVFRVFKGESFH